MSRFASVILLACATLLPAASPAHGPVQRVPEADTATARLFAADSATGEMIVVDLPDGGIVTRLATPPFIIDTAVGSDGRHVYVMRGRSTDRDTITVIDSGFDAGGQVRFPTIVRTLIGRAPNGGSDGHLYTVGGRDAIFQEAAGQIEVLGAGDFGSLSEVQSSRIKLVAPDHYHYLEAGKYLYVGYLAKGFVQIIDRDTGQEAGRIGNCPVLHGMADDPQSGRLFFACKTNVAVIGTRGDELNREVARIDYPSDQRAAAFLRGKGRVLWGKNEGALPAMLRLDPAKKPYRFKAVTVDASIQQATTEDGSRLLIYSRNGTLDIRDGDSGKIRHQLQISKPFEADYHEHVDKALVPDIVSSGDRAWITIPPEGVIVEVDLGAGTVLRRISTGGQPTRLLLVQPRATTAGR
jgi:DNA-binding beta-propeller fold protein YncE